MTAPDLPDSFHQDGYDFTILTDKDLRMVESWLKEPHVETWWTLSDNEFTQLKDNIGSGASRYIVLHHGRPFAFIQCYDPAADPQRWQDHPQESGIYGIDQFIGDPEMIGFGHGAKFLKAFIEIVTKNDAVKKVIVSLAPDNTHAVHCYRQVGFRKESDIEMPIGPAVVLGKNAD